MWLSSSSWGLFLGRSKRGLSLDPSHFFGFSRTDQQKAGKKHHHQKDELEGNPTRQIIIKRSSQIATIEACNIYTVLALNTSKCAPGLYVNSGLTNLVQHTQVCLAGRVASDCPIYEGIFLLWPNPFHVFKAEIQAKNIYILGLPFGKAQSLKLGFFSLSLFTLLLSFHFSNMELFWGAKNRGRREIVSIFFTKGLEKWLKSRNFHKLEEAELFSFHI